MATAACVALAYVCITAVRVEFRGQTFDEAPWFEISLIAAAFFLVTGVGALVASFMSSNAFNSLTGRSLALASLISAAALSVVFNADFREPLVPDWVIFALICAAPILACGFSLFAVARMRMPNNRLQATRETRAPES